jgi:hypothetical protein
MIQRLEKNRTIATTINVRIASSLSLQYHRTQQFCDDDDCEKKRERDFMQMTTSETSATENSFLSTN